MKSIVSTLLFLIISAPVLANPVPDFPFVIVTENLEKKITPDVAEVGFNLEAYAKKSDESLDLLRQAGQKVIALLEKYDVPLRQLESKQISKRAKRAQRNGAYNLEILGYDTAQSFNLKLTDLSRYPELMNELIAIDGLSGINALFKTTKEEQYKEEMIKELSTIVRGKADALAQAQSRSVKKVYGITTEGNFGQAFAIFSLQSQPRFEGRFLADMTTYKRGEMDLTMMVPEYIIANQTLTALFELK